MKKRYEKPANKIYYWNKNEEFMLSKLDTNRMEQELKQQGFYGKALIKAKKEYVLRVIAGENVLVPVGQGIADFSGIIYINETAAFLWKQLQNGVTQEQIEQSMIDKFNISSQRAQEDVLNFLKTVTIHNMLEVQDGT